MLAILGEAGAPTDQANTSVGDQNSDGSRKWQQMIHN
jgi:hypothetical protein